MKNPTRKRERIDFLFLKPSAYCFKYFWPFIVLALVLSFPLTALVDEFFRTNAIFAEYYNAYADFDTFGTAITVPTCFVGLVYFILYKASKYIVNKKRRAFANRYFELEKSCTSIDDEEYQFYCSAYNLSLEVKQLREQKENGQQGKTEFNLDCFTKDAFSYAWKYRRRRAISIPFLSAGATAVYTLLYGFNGFPALILDFLFALAAFALTLYVFTGLQMEKEKDEYWDLVRQKELLNIFFLVNGDTEKARNKRDEIEKYLWAMV